MTEGQRSAPLLISPEWSKPQRPRRPSEGNSPFHDYRNERGKPGSRKYRGKKRAAGADVRWHGLASRASNSYEISTNSCSWKIIFPSLGLSGFVGSCDAAQVRSIVRFVIKFRCDVGTMTDPAGPIGCYRGNKLVVWCLLYPYSKTWAVLR